MSNIIEIDMVRSNFVIANSFTIVPLEKIEFKDNNEITKHFSFVAGLVSTVVIHSVMSIEAKVNFEYYSLFVNKNERLNAELGLPKIFEEYRYKSKFSDLKERFKLLEKILECKPLNEINQKLWLGLIDLLEFRHSFTHPNPDVEKFGGFFKDISKRTYQSYTETTRDVLIYLYKLKGESPEWLLNDEKAKIELSF